MTAEFDIVIRNGTVLDGTGEARFAADVAISGDRIVQVGEVAGRGREEIDARGRIVTPGFVDIHTHFDGQITWEERLLPSSGHGITTVVMGNCGVGFAPCRPADRERLVSVMEGVEDIPEIVMTTGIPWKWETFPEYMDFLATRRSDVDFATQVPHSAVRVYTMGERGAELEPPTADDLDRMADLVEEGVRAGALGVSTSRSLTHRRADGVLAPSVPSEHVELEALARGLARSGRGVYQLIPNNEGTPDGEFALIRRLAEVSGRPVSYSLQDWPHKPGDWRTYLALNAAARADGLDIRAQTFPRPIGALFGLDLSFHPFVLSPSFQPIRDLPLAEKVAAMRDPELRARLIVEGPTVPHAMMNASVQRFERMYPMSEAPCYLPALADSVAARAAAQGVDPRELAYDIMMESDGKAIFYIPAANFTDNSLANVREMMTDDNAVFGLGDGGAHYGVVCDASHPTFTLSYWARDVERDQRLSLEWAVAGLSRKSAQTVGLTDRGIIAPGYKADINVIDMDRLALGRPEPKHDLPANGRRLFQPASGYDVTIVSGEVTYRDGVATDALPGRLVRGG